MRNLGISLCQEENIFITFSIVKYDIHCGKARMTAGAAPVPVRNNGHTDLSLPNNDATDRHAGLCAMRVALVGGKIMQAEAGDIVELRRIAGEFIDGCNDAVDGLASRQSRSPLHRFLQTIVAE